jgi:acetyl/propionyl-CoA carboxylase alpha subunit
MARYYVDVDEREIALEVLHPEGRDAIRLLHEGGETTEVAVDFAVIHANVESGEGLYSLIAGGKSYQVYVERTEDGLRMVIGRHRIDLQVLTEREWRLRKVAPRAAHHGGAMTVKAPMPGRVKTVAVQVGDQVQAGQRLVVLEAMKMENEITSPQAGKVTGVLVSEGATVDGGKPLVTLE